MIRAKIIHVPGIALSERLAQECIEQAKKFGIDVELFNGINGIEYQRHLDKLGIKPMKKFKKGRAGVYGCFLSHYYLWKECAEQSIPYLILEHDGWFTCPLPEDILDKFDHVLKLDSKYPFGKMYERFVEQEAEDPVIVTPIEIIEGQDNGAGQYSSGAYGYIIKPAGAKLLLDSIKKRGFLPADHQIGLKVCDVKTVSRTVVRLHPYFYSTNSDYEGHSLTLNPELLVCNKN